MGDQDQSSRLISAFALRPPEVLLGARFDAKVDVWAIGCMVSPLMLN
jgi:serine/threonine-protein kinase SRPK3